MPNGRTSSSMEEPFYIIAVPDPSVPKPSDEDLPKVNVEDHYKNDAKNHYQHTVTNCCTGKNYHILHL